MFPELNDILDIDIHELPSRKLIFLNELTCDSSFVLYHMLCTFLKHKGKVVFLSVSQSFSHFMNVGNKLGVNLKKERDDGNIVFIEGLRKIGNDIFAERGENIVNFEETGLQSLRKLFIEVSSAVNSFPNGENILMLTDDLSVLSSLGISRNGVKLFLHYLKQLLYSRAEGVCFMTLIHHDRYESDEELEEICTLANHMSDIIIKVEDLASGFSHAVHGEVYIYIIISFYDSFLGRRGFAVAAPAEWNKLPQTVRSQQTIDGFRSQLKTYLFRLAYPPP